MSSNSKRFLLGLAGAILLVFLVAGVAILAYNAGRSAAGSEESLQVDELVQGLSATNVADKSSDQSEETATEPTDEVVQTPTTESSTISEAPEDRGQIEESITEPTATPDVEVSKLEPTVPVEEGGPRVPVELDEADIELLLEVWKIIDDEFDGKLPDNIDVTYSAIAGSLELLNDNYTRFVNPDTATRLREQLNGSFEGIGAFVDLNPDGLLVIVRPIEDQPADRAGLLAGDVVTHVDGESVDGKTLEEMTADIKGPEGTEVTLTIQRESLDEPFDVTITRELIEYPIVSGEMLEDNIAYVRLTGFSANSADQLETKIQELLNQDPQALILDLRDNPGGFLSQSVQVADLFLGDGVVLYERDGRDLEEVFESEDGDLAEEIQLVILLNAGSASASEIVAGAVQDRGRGVLVGETSFGKGSVQQPHTLSDGSELRVTIARWYTPNNQSIDSNGITPDIEVASPEEFGTENDTQLQRAISFIVQGR